MGLNNGILTEPVKFSEVKTCINAPNVTSLKTLCNHENINMWAKYKPVEHSSKGGLTEQERFGTSYGIYGTYYDVFSQSGREAAITDAKNGKFGWVYNRPSGNGIYRLNDFAGYDHNSVFPIVCSCSNNQTEGYIDVAQEVNLSVGNMKISDLTSMVGQANNDNFTAGGYGVIYKKSGETADYIDAIGESGNTLYPISSPQTITFTKLAGIYEVCVYLTKNGNGSQGFIIPGSYFTVTVKDSGSSSDKVVLSGFNVTSAKKPVFGFTIKNISGHTLSEGTAYIRIYSTATAIEDTLTISIPQLAHNSQIEVESDPYEGGEDFSSMSHWTVTYQGVTSSNQSF